MKSMFVLISVLFTSVLAQAEVCRTESRGYVFEVRDRYYARQMVVDQCSRSFYTSRWECERNVRCWSNQGPTPPNYGGQIWQQKRFCQGPSECTYDIIWRTNQSRMTIVTAQAVGEHEPKMFACAGTQGQQQASWIQPGRRYIFRLYPANNCQDNSWQWQSPIAIADFYGGR